MTAAEHIVSGTPTPTLTPSDVTNAATQVTNAKTQLNGNHNLEVAKQNANTAIDGLTSLNGPQKQNLKNKWVKRRRCQMFKLFVIMHKH